MSSQRDTAKKNSYTGLSGSLLLAGGIIFFIFNTIAEASYPNYSSKTNALSDLGALGAPTEPFWNGQLFVSGLLGFIGMYLLFRRSSWSEKIHRRNLTATIFLLPSVGTILVAIFPENFVLVIHSVGALMAFVFGGVSAIYAYRLTKPPFRYISLVLGTTALVATFSLGAGALVGFGLIERLVAYPIILWNMSFGSYLIGLSSSSNSLP